MNRYSRRLIVGMGFIAAGLLSPVLVPGLHQGRALAEPSGTSEKDAFEAAKELGTQAAWNAFISNYPTGFHADLARAYLAKLGEQQPATAALPPTDDFPIVAGSWGGVVRDGPGQDHRKVDSLEEGQQVTLMGRTEVMENGYPWFKIAYEDEGKGYQWGGILCSAGAERPDLYKTCKVTPVKQETEPEPTRKRETTKETRTNCASGRVRINGKCIEKGAVASFCGPGFRAQGGKCIPGYQAPKANTPLSKEQKNAVNKGCPKGQVWNSAEGCHEDD